MWMSKDATKGSALGEQVGPRLAWHPVQVARLHRGRRYQILPAHAQDAIVLSHIPQGSTDSSVFEDFIEQLLAHCRSWPEPKSVLVVDTASFHHSEHVEQL